MRLVRGRVWALGAATLALALGALVACQRENPGPLIFVTNIMDGTVTIVEGNSGKVRSEHVGSLPHNLELSPDGSQVAVTNTGASSVTFFDAKTGARLRDMLVAEWPNHAGHASIPAEVKSSVGSCSQCHGLHPVGDLVNQTSYTPDGKGFWAVGFHPPTMRHVDIETGKLGPNKDFKDHPFGTQVSNVVFTPDGSQMVVLHRRFGQSGKPSSTGFDHDSPPGNKASLITFHSPDGQKELARVMVPLNQPYKVAWHPDGVRMYIAYRSTNKVVEVDTKAHRLLRTITVGEGPINVVVDPKGEWLYAPSFYDYPADVIKVDLATGKIRDLLAAHPSPASAAYDADTGFVYVATSGLNRLLVIDPKKPKGEIVKWHPCGAYPLDVLLVAGSTRMALPNPKAESLAAGPPPTIMELNPDGTASGVAPAWYRPSGLPWGDRPASGKADAKATDHGARAY